MAFWFSFASSFVILVFIWFIIYLICDVGFHLVTKFLLICHFGLHLGHTVYIVSDNFVCFFSVHSGLSLH